LPFGALLTLADGIWMVDEEMFLEVMKIKRIYEILVYNYVYML
jgi:hypothetical protein